MRDVLKPLKRGLGNAYKHGNGEDRSKSLRLEMFLTRLGAVFEVTNEGDGFDPARILSRLRHGDRYFHHEGGGFRVFEEASSAISFSDRGRTLLIRFLCDPNPAPRVPSGRPHGGSFVAALPMHSTGSAALEYGWIEEPERPGPVEARSTGDSASVRQASGTAAWTFAEQDPPLSFREQLREFKERADLPEVLEAMTTVGRALRALHGREPGPEAEADLERERRELSEVRNHVLQGLPPERTGRFEELFERLQARSAGLTDTPSVPGHGHFGWSCIQCGAGRLYVLGFDAPGRSHPGLDVGGFLADLLRFYKIRQHAVREFHDPSREAFLRAYFGDLSPGWRRDLDFFEARAILFRIEHLLERPKQSALVKATALLDLWERNVAAMELR
jgi:hypothetical protein